MNKSGFTLIELLVVIGIIAILVGIAQPLLSVSASRAYEQQCESRLQQVGLAMNAYVQDYGSYPAGLASVDSILQDQSLLRCPKTSRLYYYRRPAADADRGTVLASCVTPRKTKGKLPHRSGSAYLSLTVSGHVRRIAR